MTAIVRERIKSRHTLIMLIPLNGIKIKSAFFSKNGDIQDFYISLHNGFIGGFDYAKMYEKYLKISKDGYRIKGDRIINIFEKHISYKLHEQAKNFRPTLDDDFFVNGHKYSKELEVYLLSKLSAEMSKPNYPKMEFGEFKSWLQSRKENQIYSSQNSHEIIKHLSIQVKNHLYSPYEYANIGRFKTNLSLINCPVIDYQIGQTLIAIAQNLETMRLRR
jgi:hypothetical protein